MSDLEPIEYKNSVKKLGDFITLRRGKTYKSSLLGKPGAFLIGLASIEREGGFRDNKLETYGGDCPDSISLKPGDLYVSLKDITHDGHLLGAVSRIPKKIKLGRLTQDTVKLIFDTDDFPKDYIYWLLRTPQYRNYCRSRQTGTTNLGLSREDFLSFPVPPLTEKTDAIIKSLEAIEGKIENLKQQNETLEKIAQTLFKHWFIDFEFPNDDGKPYKSSGGAMVASELGDIPEGWRVGTIGEIMTLNYGKSLITDNRVNGQYLVVGSSGVVGTHNEYLVKAPGIVIGRKGTIGKVIWLENNFYPIDTTFFVTDKLGCNDLYFHYFILKNQQFERLISDSAVPGLNRDMAYSVEIIIPNISLINNFSLLARSLFNKKANNENQIQTLTKTRDALLPKLMSGQIRVKEVESLI